ncbi:MAG: hypothetical protein OEW75_14515, partial [Cyclobacteriaceae bacterium]|nr:hypothetical protein [Cyclobacteriaceae bacterium]
MLASFIKFNFNLYFLLFFALVFFGCENSFSSSDKTYIDVLPCVPKTSISTLEIATWNLRNFPLNDKTTEYLDDIIRDMGIDIIAVQEIKSVADLQKVIAKLPGWDFKITSDEDLNIGFLFNSLEVEIDNFEVLFDDQWYAFPRPLVMARAKTRANSSEILLFNIHLKCCG